MVHPFIVFILLTLLALVFYKLFRDYWPMYIFARNYSGPSALPLIGCAHHFIGKSPEEISQLLLRYARTYGNTYRIWFGPNLRLIMQDLGDLEAVLTSNNLIEKSEQYNSFRYWLGDCLFLSSGSKWIQRRKLLTPAFHYNILEQIVPVMEKHSLILVEKMWQKSKAAESAAKVGVDLSEVISLCSLDIICECAMGVSVNAQKNVNSNYVQAVQTTAMIVIKRMYDILLRFDSLYRFTKIAQLEKQNVAIIHNFIERIIIERRKKLLKAQQQNENQLKLADSDINDNHTTVGIKSHKPFLDILLQSTIDGEHLSNLDIREEVDLFMVAGHHTIISALTFLLYNMSRYLDCQQRCYDEIVQVFGSDKKRPLTTELLNQLHYVGLCIKESLRLYPPAPHFSRKVIKSSIINNKCIPAGTTISISPYHLMRNEAYFTEAHLFKPERFEGKIKPYSYIPFSAGPRNCIGQKFAMLEIRAVFTNVLRNFKVEYAGNPKEEPLLIGEISLRSKEPLLFKLNERS